jgi:hypothetical protein
VVEHGTPRDFGGTDDAEREPTVTMVTPVVNIVCNIAEPFSKTF